MITINRDYDYLAIIVTKVMSSSSDTSIFSFFFFLLFFHQLFLEHYAFKNVHKSCFPLKMGLTFSDIARLSQFGFFGDIDAETFLVGHRQEHPLNLNIISLATWSPAGCHRATGRFMATVYSGRPQPTTNINEILSK